MKTLSRFFSVLLLQFLVVGCEEVEEFTMFFIHTVVEYDSDLSFRDVEKFLVDGVQVPVYRQKPDDQNDYVSYKLTSSGNTVEFSFSVFESKSQCRLCLPIETRKEYSGTIDIDAFNQGKNNELEIVQDGDEYGLEVNGSTEGVELTQSGPEGSEYAGRWVRLPGPSGDRTDLAIGNIPGQPENRVYMCEKKGSNVAGLYKGTISGSTIVWDSNHNLPVFSVAKNGSELILDCEVCLPTNYKSGSWSGECPL